MKKLTLRQVLSNARLLANMELGLLTTREHENNVYTTKVTFPNGHLMELDGILKEEIGRLDIDFSTTVTLGKKPITIEFIHRGDRDKLHGILMNVHQRYQRVVHGN